MEIDMNRQDIALIENEIVFTIIQNALDLGYTVSHTNGEEVTCVAAPDDYRAINFKRMMKEIRQCDEEYLTFKDSKNMRVGMVYLVYGNDGHDVICDHTANDEMTNILSRANALAESFA